LDFENLRSGLVKTLKARFIDKSFTQKIDRFYFTTCDSLINNNVSVEEKPVRNILAKLFETCERKIKDRSISVLRIPALNSNFLLTLQLYQKQPLNKLFRQISVVQTAILQSAFDGLALGDSLKTFVEIRQMVNFPFLIGSRILDPRFVKYRDTLLYFLANGAPDVLLERMNENDSAFTALVQHSHNKTVKAVAQLNVDYFFDRVFPFSYAIYENRISKEEIIRLILSPPQYYHAFAEEALRLHNHPEPGINVYLKQPIFEINKDIAYAYFINEINNLHNSPDKIRFQSVSNLQDTDYYFLLLAGSNQMYTSSFLYVYNKFLKTAGKEDLKIFFDRIGYYQFDQFISNIAVYGLVNDLVSHLQEEKFAGLLIDYLAKLQNTQLTDNEIMLNGMTMSEVLYEIRQYPKIKAMLVSELIKQDSPSDVLLQRMYNGFLDILLDKKAGGIDNTYDALSIESLERNGAMVQAWFFYDDEDACQSFESAMKIFDKKLWSKTVFSNYVLYSSIRGNPVRVYMNKPKSAVGFNASQEEMLKAIASDGYVVTSFIHRGHSYHFFKTLSKLTSAAKFVFLGSCGGYNEVMKIFQLNPDIHLIVSRHMGTRLINDKILERISNEMVNKKSIIWNNLWREFNVIFRSRQEKDLFSSYIPPNKYTGVKFIRKVLNY
jgi:hypothetical protein